MIQPIRTEDDLPEVGKSYEDLRYDFKRAVDKTSRKELAKDVAVFANCVGGVILVGAVAQGERLKRYLPLTQGDAEAARTAYDLAVRDLCAPKPVVEMNVISKDDGFVLVVTVWPFPAQPVGVAWNGASVSSATAFRFPYRTGAHTKDLTPDQLPMFMLPDLRRVAVLLSSIPPDDRNKVMLVTRPPPRGTRGIPKIDVKLNLDPHLEDVMMRNTLHFVEAEHGHHFTIPADAVTHVWKSRGVKWIVAASVHLSTDLDVDVFFL